MRQFNLKRVGDQVTELIKKASWFPYRSGKLRDTATSGEMYKDNVYRIHFDSSIAEYVTYLEEGTQPHDIPNAFGRGPNFGVGGRFDGKFHPGSTKHKGFISNKSVNAIVNYIASVYEGQVTLE